MQKSGLGILRSVDGETASFPGWQKTALHLGDVYHKLLIISPESEGANN